MKNILKVLFIAIGVTVVGAAFFYIFFPTTVQNIFPRDIEKKEIQNTEEKTYNPETVVSPEELTEEPTIETPKTEDDQNKSPATPRTQDPSTSSGQDPVSKDTIKPSNQIPPVSPPLPPVPQEPQEHIVLIYSFIDWRPASLTIYTGDTVTFINEDKELHWPGADPHPTHSSLPNFDALGGISKGQTYSHTFRTVGVFGQHDHLLDNPPTVGTITVLSRE